MRVQRCPSCYEIYPAEKMIPLKTGVDFELIDIGTHRDVKNRYLYNPVNDYVLLCEECVERVENKL